MRNDLLHVVTAVSNPIRWHSRIALYKQFEEEMLDAGVNLTVVECAYSERPFEIKVREGVTHIGVRAKSLVWVKENLLNIGVSRLPDSAKYIAFIDADIHFRCRHWATEVVHALQQYDVVQPWGHCYDLGPHGEHLETHNSFCKLFHEDKPIVPSGRHGYTFAHPGYAWAFTRNALEWLGGLLEIGILGAGDHHMALALIGRVRESVPGGISPEYLRHLLQWQARAQHHICKNIGFVPGTIEHQWHGKKELRKYVDRWSILTRHKYNPDIDIKRNTHGVLELSGIKPELRHAIDRYFRQRDEDGNSLS